MSDAWEYWVLGCSEVFTAKTRRTGCRERVLIGQITSHSLQANMYNLNWDILRSSRKHIDIRVYVAA
jgi:hypothetical protein